MERKNSRRHFEASVPVLSSAKNVFEFADNHANFSVHMAKSSFMMGGSSMDLHMDKDKGQKVGSHIYMDGTVFGIKISLDEVVTKHDPPKSKIWETVGTPKLIVIGPYQMGLEIIPENGKSTLKVFIDYEMPKIRILGYLFGGIYARWCVNQMLNGTVDHFRKKNE